MTVIVNIYTFERGTVINVEISNSKSYDARDKEDDEERIGVDEGDSAPYSPTHYQTLTITNISHFLLFQSLFEDSFVHYETQLHLMSIILMKLYIEMIVNH